jgi:protease-4
MRLERILEVVYCKPWAILPSKHRAIQRILDAHLERADFDLDSLLADSDNEGEAYEIYGNTAVFPIEGTILNKCSGLEAACGAFSLQTFRQGLQEAAADAAVRNILLNISSGGGTVTGVPEAADLIRQIAAVKPVYAFTDDCIASAAYWLASQANNIFISKSAEVGSIGVYLALLDVSGAMEQDGVKMELFKAGKFKAMGLAGNPLSDEERELLQANVDKIYAQFTGYVKSKRQKVTSDTMQGQMFDAEDALANGLIDGVVNDVNALIDYLNK